MTFRYFWPKSKTCWDIRMMMCIIFVKVRISMFSCKNPFWILDLCRPTGNVLTNVHILKRFAEDTKRVQKSLENLIQKLWMQQFFADNFIFYEIFPWNVAFLTNSKMNRNHHWCIKLSRNDIYIDAFLYCCAIW